MIVFPSEPHEHKLVRAVGNACRALVQDAAVGLRSGGMAVTLHIRPDVQVVCEFTVMWSERQPPRE
jgi:hypothetical protein